MYYKKATVAKINLGYAIIEGLLVGETADKKPIFGVSASQVAGLFQFDSNQASRTLKALLGNGFQFDKIASTLHPKPVNFILLPDLERVMIELVIRGNPIAIELVRALVGLSLYQLFCDGFGYEFGKEERLLWLFDRAESKSLFYDLTDAIKGYLDTHPDLSEGYRKFIYPNCMDAINVGLFGMKAKEIRASIGKPNQPLNRDSFGRTSLRHLNQIQEGAAKQVIYCQREPMDGVNYALDFFRYPVDNFLN